MRTLLLTTATALLFCTASQAQDKTATPVATSTAQPSDPQMEQRRALSGALKQTLGTASKVLRTAEEKAANAAPEAREKYVKIVDELKAMQTGLNKELAAVNSVSGVDDATLIRAKETNINSEKALGGYMKDLGLGTTPETKGAPQSK